jgi:hypothetical protein
MADRSVPSPADADADADAGAAADACAETDVVRAGSLNASK